MTYRGYSHANLHPLPSGIKGLFELLNSPLQALFPVLLQPSLWDSAGFVPPLVRLLSAYVSVDGPGLMALSPGNTVMKSIKFNKN